MRRRSFMSLLLGVWAARLPAATRAAAVVLQLPASATTSAGIFDAQGRLIRTLWRGRNLPAGAVTIEWDGRDDDAAPVLPEGRYEARLLSHNLRYEWQGVIGNTSSAAPGTQIHRALGPVNDMAIDARGNAFYVVGYNENQPALHRFELHDPRQRTPLAREDYRRVFRYAATDGELVYFANIGLVAPRDSIFRNPDTFVVAFRVADGAEHVFADGRPREGNFQWASTIDYEVQPLESQGAYPNAPSGLAVQRRGNVLFVAHRGANQIRLFDKRSGSLLGAIAVDRPGDMDIAPDESLWVICRIAERTTVARFRERAGTWSLDRQIAATDIEPVALGVSPVDGTVAVADSRSEQIRGYDESGNATWVFGRSGGYRQGDPEVAPDRLGFSAGPTYVAFQADGSFWVGDPANQRNLHFSAARSYIAQLQYLSHSYVATVDATRPTRIFCGFLEFEVDYGEPLRQSWRLLRNWSVGLDARYRPEFIAGLRSVVTLPDGRTYGTVFRNDANGDELVELAGSGIRPLGLRLRADERLYPDGRLRSHVIRLGRLGIYERQVEGFEASGAPRWSPPVLLAQVAGLKDSDPYFLDVPLVHGVNDPSYPRTGSGLVISFNPGRSQGFHLGALRPGQDGWLWRASPTGEWQVDAQGKVLSRDGTYELGRGVQYPGNVAVASGASVIYGYHGEAWNGGQANQWLHFHESGLFLGQFGEASYASTNALSAPPGAAGNAFSPALVSVGGELYLWHNDESVHGGVHRWHIAGVSSMRLRSAPIAARD